MCDTSQSIETKGTLLTRAAGRCDRRDGIMRPLHLEIKQPQTSLKCVGTTVSDRFGRIEHGADLFDAGAVGANALVELVTGDAELL